MFHVELAPLGGILGPLKSDLGVFWAKIPLYPYNVKFSNSIFSKSAHLPILSFWILNVHIIICQFQKRSTVKHFLSLTPCSCHLCMVISIDNKCHDGCKLTQWKNASENPYGHLATGQFWTRVWRGSTVGVALPSAHLPLKLLPHLRTF